MARPRFVLLARVIDSELPAWDVVPDGVEAAHAIPVGASPEVAQAEAERWLNEKYGIIGVVWEPAGETAFLGRWDAAMPESREGSAQR